MNFETILSYNNKILFVSKSGKIRQTPFTEVLYHDDNYVLAKNRINTFYSVLDENGIEKDTTLKVVHRFQNGLLLTYKTYKKGYKSSDGIEYYINYNIYSILNYTTGKQYTAAIIQSDEIKNEAEVNVIYDNGIQTIYCFKDFIFSELFDDQYIVTANLLMSNPMLMPLGKTGRPDFDIYSTKKIWSVVDVFNQKEHDSETDIAATTKNGLTFKEAEMELMDDVAFLGQPDKKTGKAIAYKDLNSEYAAYTDRKKKNRWQRMINNVLLFAHN